MFKKSLFRELGKNTGKWASNKLFGDNWSTPYRFSNSGTSMAKQALKIEKEIEEKKVEIEEKKVNNQLEIVRLKHVFAQNRNSQKMKNEIIAMPLPENRDDLFTFANFMLSNIYGSGWDHDDEKEYLNDLSDVCLNKLKQCKIMFKVSGALFETKYLEKEIRTLKRKRFFEKYGIIVFTIIFTGVLVYINYLLGHF